MRSCVFQKSHFLWALIIFMTSYLISNSPSMRFRVSPVSPEVPGIRASAQRHRSEPGWSRADGAQRPAVNGQGRRRGHGDHRDRAPLPLPLGQIPPVFGASAHIARPQTRSDWMRSSFKFVVVINQQWCLICTRMNCGFTLLRLPPDSQSRLCGPLSRPKKSLVKSLTLLPKVWPTWTDFCTRRKPPMRFSWSRSQYVHVTSIKKHTLQQLLN